MCKDLTDKHRLQVTFECYACHDQFTGLRKLSAHQRNCNTIYCDQIKSLKQSLRRQDEKAKFRKKLASLEFPINEFLLSQEIAGLTDGNLRETAFGVLTGHNTIDDLYEEFLTVIEWRRDRASRRKRGQDDRHLSERTRSKFTEFARNQILWETDRKKLYEVVTKPSHSSNIDLTEAHTFFSRILSVEAPSGLWRCANPEYRQFSITYYVSEVELIEAMRDKKRSSPGPDKLDYDTLAKHLDLLGLIFNLVLWLRKVPKVWKESRTILIPKKSSNSPADHRPLTISSLAWRILNSVLAKRLTAKVRIMPNQKGFVPGDGINQAITTLRFVQKAKSGIRIASLDIEKAFDTVSQEAVIEGCRRARMDRRTLDYIRDMYDGNTTRIWVKGICSEKIDIKRGVRQGDPLSPILFNLVMDILVHQLESSGKGIKLGDHQIASLMFADDLILMADTDEDLQSLVNTTSSFYESVGLKANARKSFVMNTTEDIHINGETIPLTNKFRYLGAIFDPEDKDRSDPDEVDKLLQLIKKAKLRANQKVHLIRCNLIPSLQHRLCHEKTIGNTLKTMDSLIRNAVKEILHLSNDVSTSFFHLSIRNGGLGLTQLRYEVPRLIGHRMARFEECEWWVARCVSRTMAFKSELKRVAMLAPDKWDNQYRLLNDMSRIPFHAGQICMSTMGSTMNDFLLGTHGIEGGRYVQMVKLRADSLLWKDYADPPTCKNPNCYYQESQYHVMNCCETNKSAITARHDKVLDELITGFSKSIGRERCIREPNIRTNVAPVAPVDQSEPEVEHDLMERVQRLSRTYGPDLTIALGDTAYCLDVQVSYEFHRQSLHRSDQRKRDYYDSIAQDVLVLMQNNGFPECHKSIVYGLVFGSRGSICNVTYNLLHDTFRLENWRIKKIRDTIMNESLAITSEYIKTNYSAVDTNHRVAEQM